MSASRSRRLIGLVSDTHGNLDPRVAMALNGVERIVHAGDVGDPRILWELGATAPVTAVSGNTDRWQLPGEELEGVARLSVNGCRVTVVHDRADVPLSLAAESDVVVFGHSHRPLVREEGGVLWVNPGSATQPRGASLGKSVAILDVESDGRASARIVPLSEFGSVDEH